MRVANHRVPAWLRLKFRVYGTPIVFANPANEAKYLPVIRGDEFASFSVMISRTFVEEGRSPYNPDEPNLLAKECVAQFVQKFLNEATQFNVNLKQEVISVEVLAYDPVEVS